MDFWDSGLWESSLLQPAILSNAKLANGLLCQVSLNPMTDIEFRPLGLRKSRTHEPPSWVPPKCYCTEMRDHVTHVLGKSDGHDWFGPSGTWNPSCSVLEPPEYMKSEGLQSLNLVQVSPDLTVVRSSTNSRTDIVCLSPSFNNSSFLRDFER
jgi:hypothetical protein